MKFKQPAVNDLSEAVDYARWDAGRNHEASKRQVRMGRHHRTI